MSKPRIKVPKTASAGEVVTIKTLVNHKMESGHQQSRPILLCNSVLELPSQAPSNLSGQMMMALSLKRPSRSKCRNYWPTWKLIT